MATYLVYRPDAWGASMRERIRAALDVYRRECGGLPAGLAVDPREVETARRVVADMDLKVEVKALGGCLVPEVWLIMDGTPVQ